MRKFQSIRKSLFSVLHTNNLKIYDSISEIERKDWNNLIGKNDPFLEYDFFKALEISNSIGKESGWLPKYLILYSDSQEIIGLVPLFIKFNSYGEYIFDWSWANAFHEHGIKYYPKVTISIPFTPATGKRIIVSSKYNFTECAEKLVNGVIAFAKHYNTSSIHWLFLQKEEQDFLETQGFSSRLTHQYHWKNNNYKDFDDFLTEFNSKKRHQIKKERKIANENVDIQLLTGEKLEKEHFEIMYELYLSTIDKKWAQDYLKKDFFIEISNTFKENTIILLAKENDKYIAGSIAFKKGKNIYGRYWGSIKKQTNLHFELCYYRLIEYAIQEKLDLFEAGAQGQHKIPRGFLPSYTYSSHLIFNTGFSRAIDDFIKQEKELLLEQMEYFKQTTPFKRLKKV